MAAAVAQLRIAPGFVSSRAGYLLPAQLDAAPAELDSELRAGSFAHAESAATDECAFASCGQRLGRGNGLADIGRDPGWRAGRRKAGAVAGCPVSQEYAGGNGGGVARGLAWRTLVRLAPIPGDLPSSARTDEPV